MKKLIFVYNGDSGLINSLVHLMHKTFSPSTYECQLCALVYDGVSMNQAWKDFVATLGLETEYHHRDTFVKAYAQTYAAYPIALLQDGDKRQVLLDAQAFASIKTLEDLMQVVSHELSAQPAMPSGTWTPTRA